MKTRIDVDSVYLILYYGMTIEHDSDDDDDNDEKVDALWIMVAWDCKGLRPPKLNRITKQLG